VSVSVSVHMHVYWD